MSLICELNIRLFFSPCLHDCAFITTVMTILVFLCSVGEIELMGKVKGMEGNTTHLPTVAMGILIFFFIYTGDGCILGEDIYH